MQTKYIPQTVNAGAAPPPGGLMNPFDEPMTLDTDRLLNDLYGLQTSLSVLLGELARTRPQEWNRDLLNSLVTMHRVIQRQAPCLTRH